MEKLIHRHFVQQWTGEQPPTYALEFKSRNNDQLNRQDVLNVLDDQIKRVAPLARVNLTTPDLTVLVNVLHKNVLISCVRKYNERRNSEQPADEQEGEKAAAEEEPASG
ncbi:THUMP domain-containing protein 1 [Aphelenchoides fujianensis]|nr:THUMP domain-containing protein 1 [Aphelenchoides fujianensis]